MSRLLTRYESLDLPPTPWAVRRRVKPNALVSLRCRCVDLRAEHLEPPIRRLADPAGAGLAATALVCRGRGFELNAAR